MGDTEPRCTTTFDETLVKESQEKSNILFSNKKGPSVLCIVLLCGAKMSSSLDELCRHCSIHANFIGSSYARSRFLFFVLWAFRSSSKQSLPSPVAAKRKLTNTETKSQQSSCTARLRPECGSLESWSFGLEKKKKSFIQKKTVIYISATIAY